VFTERFEQALAFADRLHRKQKRKTSGVPYIAHLLAVASLVIEDGGSEDESIAALLHDSLEDQGRHFKGGVAALASEIETRFGGNVRRIVEALTERAGDETRIANKRERWRAHKLAYFAQIRIAGPDVRRVSCADCLHNARTMLRDYRKMGDRIWTRFMTGRGDDQVWAYREAGRAFRETGTGAMAEELMETMERLAEQIAEM